MPIQLNFTGGYVALNKLVSKLTGLVAVAHGTVHASGPLLSINSVTLSGSKSLTGQRHRHHLPARRRGRHDDRRTRMSSLRRDLVERKLWMVVAILVVAVVAAPVFLLKGASASTTPTVPAPPAATATSDADDHDRDDRLGGAGQGRAGPHRSRPVRERSGEAELQAGTGHILERLVIVDEHDRIGLRVDDPVVVELDRAGLDGVALSGHRRLVVLERVVAPVRPARAAAPRATAPTSTIASTSPLTQESQPAKIQSWTMYSVSVRFGKDLSVPVKNDVARLTPFPNVDGTPGDVHGCDVRRPLRGVRPARRGRAHRSGTLPARPRPLFGDRAQRGSDRASQRSRRQRQPPGPGAARRQDLQLHHALAPVALDAYQRVNDAGQCELDLANPVSYDPVTGTISSVAKNACQRHPNAVPFAYLVTAP